VYTTRIYYQDTDAGGVVYYANYLCLFEKSWFEHLISIGISLPEWEKRGTYVLIKNAFLDLIEKLQYGDTINIKTSVKEVRNAYFVLGHTVFKEGKATTMGETKMVCVDQTGKPKRIPDDFKAKLLCNVISEG
jgi:acyl-CoA thioester hydrolase